jgi:Carboxypeptidase regulatory-like domain
MHCQIRPVKLPATRGRVRLLPMIETRLRLDELAALMLFAGSNNIALPQSATASMVGIVRDQSGAAVPDVEVTAQNVATSFNRSAVTDSTGSYLIPNLPVGEYTVEAQKAGFSKFLQKGDHPSCRSERACRCCARCRRRRPKRHGHGPIHRR